MAIWNTKLMHKPISTWKKNVMLDLGPQIYLPHRPRE